MECLVPVYFLATEAPLTLGRMPSSMVLASLGLPTMSAPAHPTGPSPPLLYSESGVTSSPVVDGSTLAPRLAATVPFPPSQGFSLGHGFPLIPQKLVTKIEHFEFFNMAELLPDNVELSRKTEALSVPSTCLPKVPKKRELSHDYKGLLAWVICFCTYAAIAARKQPRKTQQLLAYMATIVREALRFDCKGWIAYDNMFRQQVAKNQETDWSSLVSMFYSLSFLSQRVDSMTCTRCMSPDHVDKDCALNSLEDSPTAPMPQTVQRADGGTRTAVRRRKRDGTPGPSNKQSLVGSLLLLE